MGNFLKSCGHHVVPVEGEVNHSPGESKGKGDGGAEAGAGAATGVAPDSPKKLEGMHQSPTTIADILSNALYGTAFHKHLALTNRSENYEFFQAVSHFKQDPSSNKHAIMEEAKKICNLYVFEAAPLRVALGDGICGSIKQAVDMAVVNKDTFNPAQMYVLSLMEKESLAEFLESDVHSTLKKRIADGEMEALEKEDSEDVKDVMSKEFLEFLGDPDLKEILSSPIGIDWFRQYLVVEFAEEGIDLLIATREMLKRSRLKEQQNADSRGEGAGDGQDGGDAEGGGGGEPEAGEGDEFDIRKAGRDIFECFIKSGGGAQCNLPGTVVKKVSSALDNEKSTPAELIHAFEQVELEIFKLLAYDPFLRFKRSGMYTKYCMKSRFKTLRKSITQMSGLGLVQQTAQMEAEEKQV